MVVLSACVTVSLQMYVREGVKYLCALVLEIPIFI